MQTYRSVSEMASHKVGGTEEHLTLCGGLGNPLVAWSTQYAPLKKRAGGQGDWGG